jgi:hypothetical protein
MTTQNSTKTHIVGLPMAAISKKSSEKSPIATPRWDFYREDAGGATGVVSSVNSSAGIESCPQVCRAWLCGLSRETHNQLLKNQDWGAGLGWGEVG